MYQYDKGSLWLKISVLILGLVGCGAGDNNPNSSTNNTTYTTYGPYTANSGSPVISTSQTSDSSGTVVCNDTSCLISGNATLTFSLSFSSVSPAAYFSISPSVETGMAIASSGPNCGPQSTSNAPSCNFTFSCSGGSVGPVTFSLELNGPAGVAGVNPGPVEIACQ